LFANEAFKIRWGNISKGDKCYKVLQNRDTACPFCTNEIIFGEKLGQAHIWEFQNEVIYDNTLGLRVGADT